MFRSLRSRLALSHALVLTVILVALGFWLQLLLAGTLDPSPVLDMTVDLNGVPDGYAAMDQRKALKVLVRI